MIMSSFYLVGLVINLICEFDCTVFSAVARSHVMVIGHILHASFGSLIKCDQGESHFLIASW